MTSYSSDASLLACLTLLYKPADWIWRIDERVVVHRTELYRYVSLKLTLPDSDLSAGPLILGSGDKKRSGEVYIPLLTPRKNRLVDISELRRTDGKPVSLATHREHETASKAMLRARFIQTYVRLLANVHQKDDSTLVALLESWLRRITRYVQNRETEEDQRIPLFENGMLTLLKGTEVRPTDEPRFRHLCELLRHRYMKLAITRAKRGECLQFEYCYRQHYFEDHENRWDRLKDVLGATPSRFRFQLPLAVRTNHYSLRFEAPTNHFIFDEGFFIKPAPHDAGSRVVRPIHSDDRVATSAPTSSSEVGGGTVSHILMTDGSSTKGYVDAGFHVFEVPPGTTAFALIATMLILFVAFGMKQVVETTLHDQSTDVPAILVALVSTAPVVASPFLPRTELYAAPLLTRLSLIASSCLGYAFALWLVLRGSEQLSADYNWLIANYLLDVRADLIEVATAHGGDLVLMALGGLTAWLARRFFALNRRFQDIRRKGL